MIKFLLVLLLGGFYHQACAASVEGLALLRTLHAKLCAEPTGEACTLLASRISTIENRAIEDLTSRVSSMRNSTAKVITLSNFLSPFVSDPEDDIDDCDDDDVRLSFLWVSEFSLLAEVLLVVLGNSFSEMYK